MFKFHYSIAQRQKKFYNRLRKDPSLLGENTILIDIDYKEKLRFGQDQPRQKAQENYKYGSCSLLGFGVYFVDAKFNPETNLEEKFVNEWNFDLLKEETRQQALDIKNAFRFLRTNETFRAIEKPNYIIFSDTGKSLRCNYMSHYYLKELAEENIRVSFNYFCEYHGKVIYLKN